MVDFQELLLLSLLNGFQLVPRVFDQIHAVDIYYVRLRHLKWSVAWNLEVSPDFLMFVEMNRFYVTSAGFHMSYI